MGDEHRSISSLNAESTRKFSNRMCDYLELDAKSHCQEAYKERITDLTQLKPGDHISLFNAALSYSYHGIIRVVHDHCLVVIHYYNTIENVWDSLIQGSLYLAKVIQSEWHTRIHDDNEQIYLHYYDHTKCHSNEETLERAINYIGKSGYSLVGNNSEHWARWCRSGDTYSRQMIKIHSLIKNKAATLLIMDPHALIIKDVAIVGAQGLGSFLGAIASGVIFTAVASISTFVNIKKRQNQKRKGELSEIAFKKYVVRRIASTSGTAIGRTAGIIVGTILIPVPILGSTVGSVIGTVSGKIIGTLSGIAISKVVEICYEHKQQNGIQLKTVPLLVNELMPEKQFCQILSTLVLDPEQVSRVVKSPDFPTLRLLFEQLTNGYVRSTRDEYQMVTQLPETIFVDSTTFEYFALLPVPDDNSPEEFALAIDLLVLRWPVGQEQPWNEVEEQVLDISDLNINKESSEK